MLARSRDRKGASIRLVADYAEEMFGGGMRSVCMEFAALPETNLSG
jgi:hypothetical protein